MSEPNGNPVIREPSKPYEPSEKEWVGLEAYARRQKKSPAAPRLKVTLEGKVAKLTLDHPSSVHGHALMMEALGTSDPDFIQGLLHQIVNVGCTGKQVDEQAINFLVSVVKGVQPKDQLETMLAAQMAAIHALTMTYARRLANVETLPQQDAAERTLNKLARTFAAQLEALKRYRTGGEQKVTVEHVTVNQGGQAIVGNVTHEGPGVQKKMDSTS